ncbi:MAG: site-specific integrase [Bacteroidales bacterium]|nr:site-specific integrase [Bacteroidales bacterium]
MAKVTFMLKKPKGAESTLIYLFFHFGFSTLDSNGKKKYASLKISTGEKVKPKFWNDKPVYRIKETKAFPEFSEMNARLDDLESKIMTVYRRIVNDGEPYPTPERVKDEFEKVIGRKAKDVRVGVVNFIEGHIKEIKHLRSENTVKKYNTTLNHLKDYSASRGKWLDFTDINIRFYNDFHQYLVIEKKFSDNTFGKYIATLKGFMNMAFENRLTDSQEHKHSKFKVLKEDVDKIYLTVDEIRKIYEYDLSDNKSRERVRDIFVMECYLGLRFSDMSALSSENFYNAGKNQFLKIKTIKTEETVIIPIHPIVREIFDKYENNLPSSISNQKTNDHLKVIGRKAEILDEVKVTKTVGGKAVTTVFAKCDLITTHTARRSFASNAYLAGIPAISIMKITGHKGEQSFLRYIRISPEENATKIAGHPFFTS